MWDLRALLADLGTSSPMMLRNWARLYVSMTKAEVLLEVEIAKLGERYRSQHPFFAFWHIADFALLDRMLIIEVDGASHNTPAQKQKDHQHTLALMERGWRVARITNDQVFDNPKNALLDALGQLPHARAWHEDELKKLSKLPPPRRGRPKGKPRVLKSGGRTQP